jgi:hypothetical protein
MTIVAAADVGKARRGDNRVGCVGTKGIDGGSAGTEEVGRRGKICAADRWAHVHLSIISTCAAKSLLTCGATLSGLLLKVD